MYDTINEIEQIKIGKYGEISIDSIIQLLNDVVDQQGFQKFKASFIAEKEKITKYGYLKQFEAEKNSLIQNFKKKEKQVVQIINSKKHMKRMANDLSKTESQIK